MKIKHEGLSIEQLGQGISIFNGQESMVNESKKG